MPTGRYFRGVANIEIFSILLNYCSARNLTEQTRFTELCVHVVSLCVLNQYYPVAVFNLLKPNGYVMHQQFNIQQLYALPTLYLCVLYLSENKQRLVPLTA